MVFITCTLLHICKEISYDAETGGGDRNRRRGTGRGRCRAGQPGHRTRELCQRRRRQLRPLRQRARAGLRWLAVQPGGRVKRLALVIGPAIAAAGIALAAPANAAQGGWDPHGKPHSWIKVGSNEVQRTKNNTGGEDFAYYGRCPGIADLHQCDRLLQGINREFPLGQPNVKPRGYWAEYYPDTDELRSGRW